MAIFLYGMILGGFQDDIDLSAQIEKLATKDAAERRKTQDAILERGPVVLPSLLEVLEGKRSGLREEGEVVLKGLASQRWEDRDKAATALSRLGRSMKPFLEEVLSRELSLEVFWRIRFALAEIGERSTQEVELEGERDTALCEILGEMGDASCAPALLARSGSKDPRLRRCAALALGRLRPRLNDALAEEATGKIIDMLDSDRDVIERCSALEALAELRSLPGSPRIRRLLREEDLPNEQIRIRALQVLGAIGGAENVRVVIEELSGNNPYRRWEAFVVLKRQVTDDFGFDPREESKEAIRLFQEWWEKKFERKWRE